MDELKQFVFALISDYIAIARCYDDEIGNSRARNDKYWLERRETLQGQAAGLLAQVEALIPAEDVCRMCGKPIEYVGPYWRHTGGYSPRHPATPKGVAFDLPPEDAPPTIEAHVDKIFAGIYGRPSPDQARAIDALACQFVEWVNLGDTFDLAVTGTTAIHRDKFRFLWGQFLEQLKLR